MFSELSHIADIRKATLSVPDPPMASGRAPLAERGVPGAKCVVAV
jgi:hypothetical protein